MSYKNINRGYQNLRVWQDAKEYYVLTYKIFKKFPYQLRSIVDQQTRCVDSVHRNIAEGYCRRGLKEYLQFLNIALSSAGESVSGIIVYKEAGHISEEEFLKVNALAYKLENGLKKLIKSLQSKQNIKEWDESFIVKESNALYSCEV